MTIDWKYLVQRFSKAVGAGATGAVVAGGTAAANGTDTWTTIIAAAIGGFFTALGTAFSPANAEKR